MPNTWSDQGYREVSISSGSDTTNNTLINFLQENAVEITPRNIETPHHKYFLGSVGKAEAFRYDVLTGERTLLFVSKTLTDSGIDISTTKDDVRGGEGASIQYSFFHDPSVNITLTDIVWKPEYLEAQLGAQLTFSDEAYITASVTFIGGKASYTDPIYPIPFPCEQKYMVWGRPLDTDTWATIKYDEETHMLTLPGAEGEYCIRFLGKANGAKAMNILSTIVPEELFLVVTAPIFAGDACAASRGHTAGHITFEVPRFQLNGAQEFTMNMSQNQTMSLAGSALNTVSEDCDAVGGTLIRIIEFVEGRDWRDTVLSLLVDEDCLAVGGVPLVFGELKDGGMVKIPIYKLHFAPSLVGGRFAAGTYVISLPDTELYDIVVVPANE